MNVPGRDTVVGIDVSRWQGTIDWDQVAPTISFAFLKSTGGDGGLYRDPSFTRNAAEASRVSVPWGAYHFASRMAFAAEVEARYFCDQIRGTGWTLPPVLDWEPSPGVNGTQALAWVLAFCAEVERQLGVRPIIYTGAYVSLDRGDALKAYDLWLAAYTPQPIRCAPWDTWTIWQYTSSARLPGITANTVDMNLADRSWLDRFTHPQPDNEEEELMGALDEIRQEFVNQDTRTRAVLQKLDYEQKKFMLDVRDQLGVFVDERTDQIMTALVETKTITQDVADRIRAGLTPLPAIDLDPPEAAA